MGKQHVKILESARAHILAEDTRYLCTAVEMYKHTSGIDWLLHHKQTVKCQDDILEDIRHRLGTRRTVEVVVLYEGRHRTVFDSDLIEIARQRRLQWIDEMIYYWTDR